MENLYQVFFVFRFYICFSVFSQPSLYFVCKFRKVSVKGRDRLAPPGAQGREEASYAAPNVETPAHTWRPLSVSTLLKKDPIIK